MWASLLGTVKGVFEDDCHGIATQIAYHWIYALFPGIFVMVGLLTALGGDPDPRVQRIGDVQFLGPFDAYGRLVRLEWDKPPFLSDQLAQLVQRLGSVVFKAPGRPRP